MNIIENKAQCKLCGEVITSAHRHDFVACSCGAIGVDGGKSYLRRVATEWDYLIELSVTEEEPAE